ncbi:MAG: hypothetical protein E7584_03110, partial [Ruminococcaceae bacterium]|nr:hypothetical protein [Oscillospiraceae bacterium]
MKIPKRQPKALQKTGAPTARLGKARNEYYENISAGLGIVQVVLYLSLFAFVVLSFLTNTNLITYQNFYHFFQDLNASAERVDIFSNDSVSYSTDEEQSFTLYRKGLAVAGNTGVTIFSATGRQLVSHGIQYNDPVAVGSGKYLLVYERGGKQYSLYNANTQMHAGETEYPISGAAVSDSGMYALISSASDANSAVYLYNNRFSLINIYKKSGNVLDAAISADGRRIALLTVTPRDGGVSTSVMLARPGEAEAIAEQKIASSLGLQCHFTDSGKLAALCTTGLAYLSNDGELEFFYDFEKKIPTTADLCADGVAICLKKSEISEKNIIIIFDKSGKIVYNDV